MKRLVALVTGGRPITSALAQEANLLVLDDPDTDVVVVRWYFDTHVSSKYRKIDRKGTTKGAALNLVLRDYRTRTMRLPDVFYTMDDDVILSMHTFEKMEAILAADEKIGMLGAWNDLSERGRGKVKHIAEESVQYGKDFCVGGALIALPARTLEKMPSEGPFQEVPRREDEHLTDDVRDLGLEACIALSVPVALLPDDGENQWYRDRILAMHFAGIVPEPPQ